MDGLVHMRSIITMDMSAHAGWDACMDCIDN